MQSLDPRTPVIVGAGQVLQRPQEGAGLSPVELAAEAARLAAQDSGAGGALLSHATCFSHVATACWPYRDEAALVAAELGVEPRLTMRSAQFGGDGALRLISETARMIGAGELDVAVLTGAEAIGSLIASHRRGGDPPWHIQAQDVNPDRAFGTDRLPGTELESSRGLTIPLFVYALIETAVRGRAGRAPDAHLTHICELWSRLSLIAAGNPNAWSPHSLSAKQLRESAGGNRLVSAPYLKLLAANIQVDMASGLVMCSAEAALAAGVARERWIFPHVGAFAQDEWFVSERNDLATSPAVRACGRTALAHAGLAIDEIAHIDIYSCFPSAVQIAAGELGLASDDPGRELSVTGGLTFGGGPGNNYSSHAVATLVARLRDDPEAYGLSTGVGWYLTKHAIGIYSAKAPSRPFADVNAGAHMERPQARGVDADFTGDARIEAYTVPFERDEQPVSAIITALTADGRRVLGKSTHRESIAALLEADPLRLEVTLSASGDWRPAG
jgi:acetyl-CoA C-acetyltransferase